MCLTIYQVVVHFKLGKGSALMLNDVIKCLLHLGGVAGQTATVPVTGEKYWMADAYLTRLLRYFI